jgi:hypothetical protein
MMPRACLLLSAVLKVLASTILCCAILKPALTHAGVQTSISLHNSLPIALNQGELVATVIPREGGEPTIHALGMQQLPWRWDRFFTRQRGLMQFKFEVSMSAELIHRLKTEDRGLGFSAKNMGNRYRLRVNGGDWIAMGWNEPYSQVRQKPRWHLLAAHEFLAGKNLIELEVKAEPANDAGLTGLELGESDASLKSHSSNLARLYASAAVVGALAFLVCCLALTMGFVTRDRFFWIVGIGEALYVLRQVEWLIEYPPVPTWIFNTFRIIVFVWYTGAMCWLSLVLINKPAPKLALFIKIYMWAALPVIALGMYFGDYRVYPLGWPAIMAIMVMITAARLAYYACRSSDTTVYVYTLGGAVALVFALYEYAMELLPTGFGYLRLGSYSLAFLSLALFVVLVQRYLSTMKTLDFQIATQNIRIENATLVERQRLMQNIHDSVGSQLVALLSLVNSSAPRTQIKTHTEEALTELRLAIDALSTEEGNLSLVLASMRHRLKPRMDAAQLRLIWQVDELPHIERFSHQHIQHVQRIFLEVVSNILQHANASQVMISARYDPDSKLCRIAISDDGKGFQPGSTTGRGLVHIQSRAEQMQALLSITQNEPKGTKVSLDIPMAPSDHH